MLPFPSHEVDPYRGMAPHFGVTSARARALHALATRHRAGRRRLGRRAAAARQRARAPARTRRSSCKPGQDIAPTDLAELLVDAGFTREDPADEHGEFAVRGGIVDIFPAGDAQPVRLEFIGDTIEIAAHLRPGDAAVDRADRSGRDRSAARRARSDDRHGVDDVFDYLVARQGLAHHRLRSATRSTRTPTKLLEQPAAQLRGGASSRKRAARAAAGRAVRRLGS